MEHLRCLRSARRALIVSAVFCIFVLLGLFFIRHLLFTFFLSRVEINAIITGIGILGLLICFRELMRILKECRELQHVSNSFQTDSIAGLKSDLLAGAPQGLVKNRCLSVLAIGGNGGSITEIAPVLADVDAQYEESRGLVLRYFLGVMILLGLIGTFWGLLSTVSGVKEVLFALEPQKIDDPVGFLTQFKSSISGMMGGLSTSFSTSLFGLAGSVLLGFVEVQTRQARSQLHADLDYFVIGSLLPATTEATSARMDDTTHQIIPTPGLEDLLSSFLDRFDKVSDRIENLLEETTKSRQASERTGRAIQEIFESEDRVVNRILSIGLANLRTESLQKSEGMPDGEQRKKQEEGA